MTSVCRDRLGTLESLTVSDGVRFDRAHAISQDLRAGMRGAGHGESRRPRQLYTSSPSPRGV